MITRVVLQLLARWAAVQIAAIFCLVTAVILAGCALTNHAYAVHLVLQAVLFYGLYWRLQGKAYAIDPAESGRLTAAIKAHGYGRNW